MLPRAEVTYYAFSAEGALGNFDVPRSHQVKVVNLFTLSKDELAGINLDQLQSVLQKTLTFVALLIVQRLEDAETGKLLGESSPSVDGIQQLTSCGIALQEIEYVSANFEEFTLTNSDDGCVSPLVTHATHLTKDNVARVSQRNQCPMCVEGHNRLP